MLAIPAATGGQFRQDRHGEDWGDQAEADHDQQQSGSYTPQALSVHLPGTLEIHLGPYLDDVAMGQPEEPIRGNRVFLQVGEDRFRNSAHMAFGSCYEVFTAEVIGDIAYIERYFGFPDGGFQNGEDRGFFHEAERDNDTIETIF